MQAFAVARSQKSISFLLLFSLVFGQFSVLPFTAASTVSAQTESQADTLSDALLLRTHVTLRQANDLGRIEAMGAIILEAGEEEALLLVTADQLESLARLRFQPRATDSLYSLAFSEEAPVWLAASLQPILTQAEEQQKQVADGLIETETAAAEMKTLLAGVTLEQRATLASLNSIDDDGDGLTNTQESWWCTDPLDIDSDGDGADDGSEVQAAKDWLANKTSTYPATGKPFAGWPDAIVGCQDDDMDSVPDLAEVWDLGLNPNRESTDRDKFDDGQELFGNTNCPGSGGYCGYGSLPRNEDWGTIFAEMPSWVEIPGNHPLIGAFPVPEIDLVADLNGKTFFIETVTTVTTDHVIASGTEESFSTSVLEGISAGTTETETWNDWMEISKYHYDEPVSFVNEFDEMHPNTISVDPLTALAGFTGVVGMIADLKDIFHEEQGIWERLGFAIRPGENNCLILEEPVEPNLDNLNLDELQIDFPLSLNEHCLPAAIDGSCISGSGYQLSNPNSLNTAWEFGALGSDWIGDDKLTINSEGNLLVNNKDPLTHESEICLGQTQNVSLQTNVNIPAFPRVSSVETNGHSYGGSFSTTHTEYEEHSVTNGEAFSAEESWGIATAVDSAHAADLWFSYKVSNIGTEYAREICNLAFNIYIGNNDLPTTTYFVGNDIGGSGCFQNFMPNETHTYTTARIPLSLEQMRSIDLGAPVRLTIEDYTYGIDELFYQDATNSGVVIAMEDGTADGDEIIDSYLIPSWGTETVLDVVGRYFPHETDAEGDIIAIWTPEHRSDTPAWCQEPQVIGIGAQRTLWCKHALSVADWWNIYTNSLGDGTQPLQQTPAVAGGTALFRFNQDSDLDGYSDRSEWRFGTDENDASSFPQPELIAGLHTIENGNYVTSTLSFLNTGLYDAYGVESVMIAPNPTISITNNTIGGSGRVPAQEQVIVGSRIFDPSLTYWTGTAVPFSSGYYSGGLNRVYTFTANGTGEIGTDPVALDWTDNIGESGSVDVGSSYASPTALSVGSYGLEVGLLSGTITHGDIFTVAAKLPADTFQYQIESDPHASPVVVVSYNDPQGNHRFVTPITMTHPADNLIASSGLMLEELGVQMVTTEPITQTGVYTTNVVINWPVNTPLEEAHLFLEFINITGTVAAEIPVTTTIQTGPNVVPVSWSTDVFSPTFQVDEEYIVMAFWTDWQGNIIDTAARPLSSFQADPKATFATDEANLLWDFGTVQQGTLIQRQFQLVNVGFWNLLTYIGDAPGINLQGPTSSPISPADTAIYTMALNTASLPAGAFLKTIPIRTSDPQSPTRTLTIQGNILSFATDSPPSGTIRPLDWSVTVPAPQSQGTWYTFNHTLGPTPQTLHPVKAYSQNYGTLWGVGKYATDFSQGTSSSDMFGDGRDGVMPTSGNLDNNNGFGIGTVNGSIGSTSIAVIDRHAVWRVNPGDVVLIHQTQGTGAGNWEMNKAVSNFTGSGTFTLETPLSHTYITDSGNNKAQIVRVPQYSTCSVSGSVTPLAAWNGTWGGIFAVKCQNQFTLSGSINGTGYGFRGGQPYRNEEGSDDSVTGQSGESYSGPSIGWIHTWGGEVISPVGSANGGGGAGGTGRRGPDKGAGGGGGSYGTQGTSGQGVSETTGGIYGSINGNSILTNINLGSGGGAGGRAKDPPPSDKGYGGIGGGIIMVWAREISILGSIQNNGTQGADGGLAASNVGAGGGGSGGSVFLSASTAIVGINKVVGAGGSGGNNFGGTDFGGAGGSGGNGRIRIEYCETLTGSTNPSASTQKLNCHMVEQVETSPYTQGRLNLPENISNNRTYMVQYGRRLVYSGSSQQATTLRVPANAYATSTLNALVSGVSGSVTLRVDIGSNGAWDWQKTQTINNAAELTSIDLSAAFNAYWATQGYPTSGNLDVPVTVSLNQAGQVLLTNLQMVPSGSTLRYVRTASVDYSSWLLNLTAGTSGSGSLAIAADVGDDGSIEWAWSGTTTFPARLTTGNLATAVNAYLSGQSGDVDVPVRFYLAPFSSLSVNSVAKTAVSQPDATLSAGDINFTNNAPTETDVLTVTATLHNPSTSASGGATAAFFATDPNGYELYIGSAFVPDISAGGSATAAISWDTTGYTGTVPVRVVIDPYNRVIESNETNNEATQNLTVLSRPDLKTNSWDLLDTEPVAGEMVTITVDLLNEGQTASGMATHTLYNGNPNNGGLLLDSQPDGGLGGNGSDAIAFSWLPSIPGPYQLFLRLDENNTVNEFDEANNLLWQDVYVGLAGPVLLDSGVTVSDPAYSSPVGYGYVDTGSPDVLLNCGGSDPEDTLRRDPDGSVNYRFNHLQPGHFYHLDITLFECDGAGRQENILVDGHLLTGPEDLGDGEVHKLSLQLDPALYADRMIDVSITAPGIDGAVVAAVNLHDVDYRYADAGGNADPEYGNNSDYGWLEGVANSAWGTLPYQSVRVDQNDNQVSYRFDNLDPSKRYNVWLTFWQGSGAARIQKVRIDGLETGITVDSGDFLQHEEKIGVPLGSYASDGSIVVSIIRLNASSGAMVNEIALEEETLASAATCDVQTTPFFSQVYGSVALTGVAAPPGTVVQAFNPRGDVVGCFTVNNSGLYGFMRVYGEDSTANPPIPGMRTGELVSFKVSGSPAVATPMFYWQDDKASHPVNLNAAAMDAQFILLSPGWNWLSLNLEPPTPLVAQAFDSIDGRYDRVLGENGIYDVNLPPVFNSLTEIHAGLGYMLRITGTASVNLLAEGVSIPPTTPIPLHQGWNWVGYLPTETLPITVALQSITGQYQLVLGQDGTFDPDLPQFSDLQEMTPGNAYMLYADTTATLTYPPSSQASHTSQAAPIGNNPAQTPQFTIVYGEVRLNGTPASPGTIIEAVTPRGDVAGRFMVQQPGLCGFMRIYGEDETAVPTIPGFRDGEEITWRVNGHDVENVAPMYWQNDWATHEIELNLLGYWIYLPIIIQ